MITFASYLKGKGKSKFSPLLLTLLIFGAFIVALSIFSVIWTDWLWFKNLNFGIVFTTLLINRILMFIGFGLLIGTIVGFNMWIAYRLRPKTRKTVKSSVAVQLREILDHHRNLLFTICSIIIGILGGIKAIGMTEIFLAWRHSTPFGTKDPYFNMDISFYMFSYPWWTFVVNYLLVTLVVSVVVSAIVHFATGSLIGVPRLRNHPANRDDAAAQGHLSILMGFALLVYAGKILLDRFSLAITKQKLLTGITYTDFNAKMPALLIMFSICLICAMLFFYNAWRVRWAIPFISLALMIVSGIILSGIYPWLIQSFQVSPSGPNLEVKYIQENMNATRKAFGIDKVSIEDYKAKTTVSSGQLKADAEALPAIRLMDPAVVSQTFEQLQQVRSYYQFPKNLDIDRYKINGTSYDSVVAVRELELSELDNPGNWSNKHTVYTHGYGMVAAYGNKRRAGGEPVFMSGGIPTQGILPKAQSRIYYGALSDHYVVVGAPKGSEHVELDTPGGGKNRTETRYTYEGKGGVPIGNWFSRLLFGMRFGSVELVLSKRVNSESRLMFERVPKKRLEKLAPWLTFDQDPYPSVVDGRIVWILDGYTTSSNYPNSELIDWDEATSNAKNPDNSQIPVAGKRINYLRNSVKATVDAYDGTVKLYGWDESDPILQTWMKVYPGLVLPKSEISPDLLSHLRYPQDIFNIQREVLGTYHTSSPETWYQQNDLWETPQDPSSADKKEKTKQPAYFLTIKWPSAKEAHYSLTTVFVPKKRQNLSAYMAVNSDATSKEYGKLRVLKLSDAKQIAGPGQTFSVIKSAESVAGRLLPYLQKGSAEPIYGNLLTLPVGGGLLYVQPIYTQNSTSGGYPVLRFVVVRFGETIGVGETLKAALDSVFKGDAGADTGETIVGGPEVPDAPSSGKPTTSSTPIPSHKPTTSAKSSISPASPVPSAEKGTLSKKTDDLLKAAQKDFEMADEALRKGNLGEYQQKTQQAKEKVAEALKSIGH